jgi:hypothetical protein
MRRIERWKAWGVLAALLGASDLWAQTTMPAPSQFVACLTLPPGVALEYPARAARRDEQGVVVLRLDFERPGEPPRQQVVARPASDVLLAAARDHAARMQVTCLPGQRTTLEVGYRFALDGAETVRLNDLTLRQLVGSARSVPRGVFFDLSTMECPFDLRVTYWRPHRMNRVGQLDRDVPARRAFMDWISAIELRLDDDDANRVLGTEFTLSVPCGTVNL